MLSESHYGDLQIQSQSAQSNHNPHLKIPCNWDKYVDEKWSVASKGGLATVWWMKCTHCRVWRANDGWGAVWCMGGSMVAGGYSRHYRTVFWLGVVNVVWSEIL